MHIDATGIMRSARMYQPKPITGVPDPAARLRLRIGLTEAVLKAGAASEGSDPAFRAGCVRMLADVAEMRAAWVSAFGFEWETGEVLEMWRRPRTPLIPLLQSAYVNESQLRFHKPWVNAANVAERVARTAERAALPKPVAAPVEAAWKEKDREARRQEEERVSFRAGTLRKVRFPNERPARVRVASRWG